MIFPKPPLNDLVFLEHHGVKGMHWGVRRSGKTGFHPSDKTKKQLKIAGAVALGVAGAAAATYVLNNHGAFKIPEISNPISKPGLKLVVNNKQRTSSHGDEAVKAFDEQVWKQRTSFIMEATQLGAKGRIQRPR